MTDTRRRRMIWAVAALATVALGGWTVFGRGGPPVEPYRTLPVDRGDVVRAVTATGGLQPLVTVDVGSTVSGPVKSVEADFNAQVKAGQVLARLDPQTFQTRVQQLDASLAQAQADFAVAQADWDRYQRLGAEGFASPQLLAQKRAALDKARASVAVARAQLASAQVDLDRSVIRSPVDGVVVDRKVEPGQSVAASFQAPTLFIIARDLSKLQAEIAVDEADIGEVREGLPVRFTVDAFPGEDFTGAVSQVRKQGAQASGVVSYTVIVEAENRGGRLLPGMTANAEILVEERRNVLRLPNAALRFRPGDPKVAAKAEAVRGAARERVEADRDGKAAAGEGARAIVWVLRDGAPEPVAVRLGVASDSQTEVLDGLKEKDPVVVGGGPALKGKGGGIPGGPPPGGPRLRGA